MHSATRRLAEQTTNALATQGLAEKLQVCYCNLELRQRAGRITHMRHSIE